VLSNPLAGFYLDCCPEFWSMIWIIQPDSVP
jgi:hypothetical protein